MLHLKENPSNTGPELMVPEVCTETDFRRGVGRVILWHMVLVSSVVPGGGTR